MVILRFAQNDRNNEVGAWGGSGLGKRAGTGQMPDLLLFGREGRNVSFHDRLLTGRYGPNQGKTGVGHTLFVVFSPYCVPEACVIACVDLFGCGIIPLAP